MPTAMRPPSRRSLALLLAAGIAAPAGAGDKSWVCSSGAWSYANCWSPVGTPISTDVARIGDIGGVQNRTVRLDMDDVVAGLHITNNNTFRTDGFLFDVNGGTTVSGDDSQLIVSDSIVGSDFETNSLTVSNGAHVWLNDGGISSAGLVTIGSDSWLSNDGMVQMTGGGTTLVNNGSISGGLSGLHLYQLNGGLYDLDGSGSSGRIFLGSPGGVLLAVHGTALTDSFSGEVVMGPDAQLHMNLSNGWVADVSSVFTIDGGGSWTPARLTGAPLEFSGWFDIADGDTKFRLEADTTFRNDARTTVGDDSTFEAVGDTVVEGASFTLLPGATLDFNGQIHLAGAEFKRFLGGDAYRMVRFWGPTEWAGNVQFQTPTHQVGHATVTAASVIDADMFNMDGAGAVTWTVNAGLVVNATQIDEYNNVYHGSLNVAGTGFARLTINLSDADEAWIAGGQTTLGGLPGAPHLLATRIAGTPVVFSGDLQIPAGRVQVTAPATLAGGSTVNIAGNELRLNAPSTVEASANLLGAGVLGNGPLGDMTLQTGLATNNVGLLNAGVLRVGENAGIVSVDRFENDPDGVWAVQVGGHAAGTEYDRLIVAGGSATLAGTLEVEVTDEDGDGVPFRPQAGDTFTVLTAVGGVSGSFHPTATSVSVDGYEYEWEVLTNPNDVTIRVLSVVSPCVADFNSDGAVNTRDVIAFLNAWNAADPAADVTGDGLINTQDVIAFLNVWNAGC